MSKFWEHNNCVVLYWDKEQHVTGLKIEKKGDSLTVIETASSTMGHLATSLADVKNELVKEEAHLILAGSILPGSVSFDLNIPKMAPADMRQAITYELPRHIPCELQDVIFGYRITEKKGEEGSGKDTVRILAVRNKQWNELLSELTGSGIKIDSFLTPFLAVDPVFSEEDEIIFETDEKNIVFCKGSEFPGRRIVAKDRVDKENELDYEEKMNTMGYSWSELPSIIRDSPKDYFPALLIASYGLSPEFASDRQSLIRLPSELVPERYRALRTAFFALIGAILLLVVMLIGRFWWESAKRYEEIQNEINSINIEKQKIRSKMTRLQSRSDFIKQITEAQKGNAEIVTCLYKITQELPKDMWLGHFQTRDDTISLSFRYTTKSGTSNPDFNSMEMFKMVDSRSATNPRDGSTTEYIRLEYLPPEKRNEK